MQEGSAASFLPALSTLFASSTGIQELYCSFPRDEEHPVIGAVGALLHHILSVGIPSAKSVEDQRAAGAGERKVGLKEPDRGQLEADARAGLLLSILRSIYVSLPCFKSSWD